MVVRNESVGDESTAWWQQQGAAVLTTAQHPELSALFAQHASAEAFVVRPDRYVFGIGSLDELTGAARQALIAH